VIYSAGFLQPIFSTYYAPDAARQPVKVPDVAAECKTQSTAAPKPSTAAPQQEQTTSNGHILTASVTLLMSVFVTLV